jgi:putative Mn2+ efflux pump MntP
MTVFPIILIAVALAMDAFAVSITSGITISRMRIRHALLIASFFGVFQGMMPLIGWHAGQGIRSLVASWDHCIDYVLLVTVGVRMIYEACRAQGGQRRYDPLNIYVLFVLSVATSIDALAVGLTLSFVDVRIVFPALVIGVVTFVMSFVGTYVGAAFGHFLEKKVEVAAGFLLIGIGVKILVEHTLG